jgi:hypothetical protein
MESRKLALQQPPQQFSIVDTNLYRALLPFKRAHIFFMRSQEIDIMINLSTRKLEENVIELATSQNIIIYNTTQPTDHGQTPISTPTSNQEPHEIESLNSLVFSTVELLVSFPNHRKILLIGDIDNCWDAVVIAIIRRLQNWSLTSILLEFRFHGGRDLFDMEQFIEAYDLSSCEAILPEYDELPSYIQKYKLAKGEEDYATNDTHLSAERRELLKKLFYAPADRIISNGVTYDPALSLINEKDDD